MTPTQPTTPDNPANRMPSGRPDADTVRLCREIDALNTRHREDTSALHWNTYFDELVQRRPAGFSISARS